MALWGQRYPDSPPPPGRWLTDYASWFRLPSLDAGNYDLPMGILLGYGCCRPRSNPTWPGRPILPQLARPTGSPRRLDVVLEGRQARASVTNLATDIPQYQTISHSARDDRPILFAYRLILILIFILRNISRRVWANGPQKTTTPRPKTVRLPRPTISTYRPRVYPRRQSRSIILLIKKTIS